MASLRLTFPEKDQPTVIALTGARLTIGRLPFNTIQIIDRTVSGFHAELISEHGHYRLHDRGSSNGTYVNGQKVSDYHLNESCTISFGTVEAQFSPADLAANEEAETFPSRGEVNQVRQENVEMRATVAALREEIEALRKAPTPAGEGASATVAREEYERVVVEREALKEMQVRREEKINQLKTDLAILKRDRLNLQFAYDGAQRELEQLSRQVNGADDEPALPPVEAAAFVASQADEVRIEMPKPAAAVVPAVGLSAPVSEPPEPEEPAVPTEAEPKELLAPAASLPEKTVAPEPPFVPKTPSTFAQFSKPSLPAKLPGMPGSPQPAKAPLAPGSLRPMPRSPSGPVGAGSVKNGAGARPESSATGPATRQPHRPLPPPRQIPQATTKLNPTPGPKVGPKGTQKLTE